MPIHDWSRVEPGIFHDFHHAWIEELKRVLNAKVLPDDYYAMAEQHAAGFGPDVLTLQGSRNQDDNQLNGAPVHSSGNGTVLTLSPPQLEVAVETEMEFYRRKQNHIAIRHVSGDRVVAMIEVVSPGNKNTRNGLEAFVRKAAELLDRRIHLLILDLIPPGNRGPHGIHPAIWEYIAGEELPKPIKPLTLVAYETDLTVRGYVKLVAVGDLLPDMPLFLEPQGCVDVPLESTYQAAFDAFPRRWRRVLEAPNS